MLSILEQIFFAVLYYAGLVAIVRLAGKRLAGQTTTFDLIILISLGVTLQGLTLMPGKSNALVFIVTVFLVHLGAARASQRYPWIRVLMRGKPRPLIHRGQVMAAALRDEGLTEDELLAALRKMGCDSPAGIKLAVLEETGHITAVKEE